MDYELQVRYGVTAYTLKATIVYNSSQVMRIRVYGKHSSLLLENNYPTLQHTNSKKSMQWKLREGHLQTGDQEALIQLLFQFKTNLIMSLKTELVAKGIALATLDNITAYADSLILANVSQESFKASRKTITAEAIMAFNEIHSQIMAICKIATKLYLDSPTLKDQFSFAKVSKTLNIVNLPPAPPTP